MPFRPGKISEASNNNYNSFNEYLNNYTQADLREKPESFIFNTGTWAGVTQVPSPKFFLKDYIQIILVLHKLLRLEGIIYQEIDSAKDWRI